MFLPKHRSAQQPYNPAMLIAASGPWPLILHGQMGAGQDVEHTGRNHH